MIKMDDIHLSREQENCISYAAGDLVVNGVPGSGKSVVLMRRAVELYKENMQVVGSQCVWLTTYGNILTKYIRDTFSRGDFEEGRFKIDTMDSYCASIYYKEFGWINYLKDKERPDYVSRALQNHYRKTRKESKFYSIDPAFWAEEFIWIKQKHLMTPEEYVIAERTGRGGAVRIRREDRRFVYEIFKEYCSLLAADNKVDREDIYIRLLDTTKNLSKYKYDYVLVDEGQDLSYVKLKVAKMLCRKNITIAADRAQKIYKTGFTWKELGIDISRSGSKNLHKSFRSTKQIVQLAESLSEINRVKAADKGEYTEPVYPTRIGKDYPYIIECSDKTNEKEFLIGLLKGIKDKGITIGVLYRDYLTKTEIESFLKEAGIAYEEIRRDAEWSLETPGVKLVTLHSSKGLEFDTVIIPLFNAANYPPSYEIEHADAEQIEEIMSQERNLLYVGMTRARYELFLMYSGAAAPFLKEFNPDYYHYVSSKGAKLEKPQRIVKEAEIKEEEQEETNVVKLGDTIKVHKENSDEIKIMYGSRVPDLKKWPFIGARIGETVRVGMNRYIVDSICLDGEENEILPPKKDIKKTWEDMKGNVVKKVVPYIEKLEAVDAPVATTFGPELMGPDGRVIAEGEMSWEKEHIVFLRPDQEESVDIWKANNWKVLTLDIEPLKEMFCVD